MIVVCFHTGEKIYQEHVKVLRESLERFGLRHDIQQIKSKGQWRRNVGYKPVFMLEMLEKYQEPVLWLDADSVVRQHPAFFDNAKCDIAYFYWGMQGMKTVVTNTLYFGNTPMAKKILKKWREMDEKYPNTLSGQVILKWTLAPGTELALQSARLLLPMSYSWCGSWSHYKGFHTIKPVIEQFTTIGKIRKEKRDMKKLGIELREKARK